MAETVSILNTVARTNAQHAPSLGQDLPRGFRNPTLTEILSRAEQNPADAIALLVKSDFSLDVQISGIKHILTLQPDRKGVISSARFKLMEAPDTSDVLKFCKKYEITSPERIASG